MEKLCSEHKILAKLNQWGKYSHINGKKPDGTPAWCNKSQEELEMVDPKWTGSPTTREDLTESKAVWEAKDRQSIAQTAMKSASEIVAALINSSATNHIYQSIEDAEGSVRKMANEFYKELKRMKADDN